MMSSFCNVHKAAPMSKHWPKIHDAGGSVPVSLISFRGKEISKIQNKQNVKN